MKITVLAPAFYPSAYPIRYLVGSAARHHVPLTLYGVMEPFNGWIDTHVVRLLEELKKVESSHVLFTDASDVIFLAGLDEIEERYRGLGSPPMLVSQELSGLNAGQWIGETEAAIDILSTIAPMKSGDPQVCWRDAYQRGLLGACLLDEDRLIFQVVEGPLSDDDLSQDEGPSMLHFAGGYTDPVQGKKELIDPVWKKLGYDI